MMDTGTEGCYSSPALAEDTLYVGSDGVQQNFLFALDPETGKLRWKFATPTQIFATPAVAAGKVFFHARNDHVYAVRAADGELLWKVSAPYPQDDFTVFTDMCKSSPAVGGGKVFVGVGTELWALDAASGATVWRAPTRGKVDSSPLVVGGTVYVGSDDRSVYGFDAATGKQRWSFPTQGKVSVSPQVGEGLLLIGSNDGRLYAFGPAP